MAGDYEEAERRIAEAKASGAASLALRYLSIERLPDSLRDFPDLKELDLRCCPYLRSIESVASLKKLKKLSVVAARI